MKIQSVNVIELKRKIYQRYREFNKFYNIDEARKQELRKEISYLTSDYEKLELYVRMLQFLTSPNSGFFTFDEKIFCLIEACDPNLDYLRTFNKFGSPKKGEIEFDQYLNSMKDKTGFADDTLRKFENAYLRTIVYGRQQEEVKTLGRTRK